MRTSSPGVKGVSTSHTLRQQHTIPPRDSPPEVVDISDNHTEEGGRGEQDRWHLGRSWDIAITALAAGVNPPRVAWVIHPPPLVRSNGHGVAGSIMVNFQAGTRLHLAQGLFRCDNSEALSSTCPRHLARRISVTPAFYQSCRMVSACTSFRVKLTSLRRDNVNTVPLYRHSSSASRPPITLQPNPPTSVLYQRLHQRVDQPFC